MFSFYCSSCFNFFNSISYFLKRARWSTSSLIRASFFIFLALVANFKVLYDSAKASDDGDIIAIIVVLQFPPRESSNILVNFESL